MNDPTRPFLPGVHSGPPPGSGPGPGWQLWVRRQFGYAAFLALIVLGVFAWRMKVLEERLDSLTEALVTQGIVRVKNR